MRLYKRGLSRERGLLMSSNDRAIYDKLLGVLLHIFCKQGASLQVRYANSVESESKTV